MGYLAANNVSPEVYGDLDICIGEAIANCVLHCDCTRISIQVEVWDDRVLLYIRDYGDGFVFCPEVALDPAEIRVGGRGCLIMREYGDAVWELADPGTRVTLTKMLESAPVSLLSA